jgi:hypothetical protein
LQGWLLSLFLFDPRVVAALQLWAEISQRLRRIRMRFQTDAVLCVAPELR